MYAIIENSKVVNLISVDKRGADSLIAAGLNLVQTEKPITIGDDYTENKFYRDGSEVFTDFEKSQAENTELTNLLAEAVELQYQSDLEVIENV